MSHRESYIPNIGKEDMAVQYPTHSTGEEEPEEDLETELMHDRFKPKSSEQAEAPRKAGPPFQLQDMWHNLL